MIHILKHGRARCEAGMPSEWRAGDKWVAYNADDALVYATCDPCRQAQFGEPPRDAAPAAEPDSPVGFDRAPERYMAHGRETIDRMRDRAFVVAEAHLGAVGDVANALADVLFVYHCEVTAMKYADRAGRKDDEQQDRDKAVFYRRMAAHVRGFGPDPRSERADFTAYRRPG